MSSLATYLNDHLAGSVTALELLEHLGRLDCRSWATWTSITCNDEPPSSTSKWRPSVSTWPALLWCRSDGVRTSLPRPGRQTWMKKSSISTFGSS